jgi:hypothetical protein
MDALYIITLQNSNMFLVIHHLNIKLSFDFGNKLLINLLDHPDLFGDQLEKYIKYFLVYLDVHTLHLLYHKCPNIFNECVNSSKFNIKLVTYELLSSLVSQNNTELLNFILNHKEFIVDDDLLTTACNDLDFRMVKILINHRTCKY